MRFNATIRTALALLGPPFIGGIQQIVTDVLLIATVASIPMHALPPANYMFD